MSKERRHDCISLTSSRIKEEIIAKLEILKREGYDFYRGPLANSYETYIEHEANTHSAKIETDEEDELIKHGRLRFARRPSVKKLIRQLEGAYAWGIGTLARRIEDNDPQIIDADFVRALAYKVDPMNFVLNKEFVFDENSGENLALYRNHSVTVSGSRYTRTAPDKIPLDMDRFLETLNERMGSRRRMDVIDNAICAHFHILRIHPFSDGNGRTARTLQNLILKQNGMPAPIIYAGERHDYYDRIEKALHAWRERTGSNEVGHPDESAFYSYIAGKMSATLDRMIDYAAMRKRAKGNR
ncbi:MAG: Fic family protein [archaeon]|nr:Fic family protein [archaeon]